MPDHWFQRMETIQTWEEDGSASERVRAWNNAIDLANTRFIGGGMRALVHWGGRDSHSIYFGMLGEHGWVGLGMFLLLLPSPGAPGAGSSAMQNRTRISIGRAIWPP
jgi:hypothetical protein